MNTPKKPKMSWTEIGAEFDRMQRDMDEALKDIPTVKVTPSPKVDSTVHLIEPKTWTQRRRLFLVFWRVAWAVLLRGRSHLKINTPTP